MRILQNSQERARGFSLIELMVVVVMISIVMAAVLSQVRQVQQRSMAEQGRVDDFQQARDFMNQIVRDGRQVGYPNSHNYDINATPTVAPNCFNGAVPNGMAAWQPILINDCRIAAGIIRVTPTRLDVGGDFDGSGKVEIVSYAINGDGACPLCMERAQMCKTNVIDPLTQANTNGNGANDNCGTGNQTLWVQEVQNVQNANNAAAPIFSAYNVSGAQIPLGAGLNILANANTIAQIRTIKVNLAVANPKSFDPQTHRQLESDVTGTVQIVNCSMAATGTALVNAGVTAPGFVQVACQP